MEFWTRYLGKCDVCCGAWTCTVMPSSDRYRLVSLCVSDGNQCDPNPCQNGTCVDQYQSYFCVCIAGFEGKYCHIREPTSSFHLVFKKYTKSARATFKVQELLLLHFFAFVGKPSHWPFSTGPFIRQCSYNVQKWRFSYDRDYLNHRIPVSSLNDCNWFCLFVSLVDRLMNIVFELPADYVHWSLAISSEMPTM